MSARHALWADRCNGLQWKWLRTAINENLGPDYLHLSIPSGRDYLQLRLLLSSWDCNRRRWDHIKCDSPNHRLRPVLMRGEAYASLKNALEVLLSRTSLDLGPRVSHHTSKHPIETQKLSPLLCSMRVDLTKTGAARRRTEVVCRAAPVQLQIMWSGGDGLQAQSQIMWSGGRG